MQNGTHLNPPANPNSTRRSILLLSFATFSSMAVQRICDAMLPELAQVFSASLAQAAAVVSMFAVIYGLAQLFYGPLGDRLGKYRVLSWATLASSLGCGLSVIAPSLDVLVFARMLAALTAAAIIPLALAWIGDHIAYEQRQETLARLGLGTTLGITVGQLAGGFLTDTLGWRWAFVFVTLLFAAVGLLLLADLRVQQSRHPVQKDSDEPGDVVRPGFVLQAWLIVTAPWARIVLVVAFIEGAAGFGVLAIWAAHLHLHLDIGLSAAGAMVALFGLGGMLYMALARRMIGRLGERGLALGGGIVLLTASIGLACSPWVLLAWPLCFFGGFGFFMFHNTMQANATQMSPTARGTAVSLFAACLFLGQSLGVLLAASLVERWGSQWVIAAGGGVMAVLGLYFSRALGRREQLMTV